MARQPPHNPDLHVVNPGDNGDSKRSRRREIAEAAAITVVVTLLISGGASFLWQFSKKRAEKMMNKRRQAESEHELIPQGYPYQAYAAGYPYAYGPPQPVGPPPVGKTIPEALSMDPRLRPVETAAPVVVGVSQDPGFTHFARALEKRLGGIERTLDRLSEEDDADEEEDEDEDEDEDDEDEDEEPSPPPKKNARRRKAA